MLRYLVDLANVASLFAGLFRIGNGVDLADHPPVSVFDDRHGGRLVDSKLIDAFHVLAIEPEDSDDAQDSECSEGRCGDQSNLKPLSLVKRGLAAAGSLR